MRTGRPIVRVSGRHSALSLSRPPPEPRYAEGMQVILTQRTAHLSDHAGQISFPGGRVEPEDASREDTALRETEEEIGLARAHVQVLGRLPEYDIPSGFRITPVVGWVEPPFDLKLDPFEVACVFEAPLSHFLEADGYERRQYHFRGRHRHYIAVPYEGRYIWGATAGMLHSLAQALWQEARSASDERDPQTDASPSGTRATTAGEAF